MLYYSWSPTLTFGTNWMTGSCQGWILVCELNTQRQSYFRQRKVTLFFKSYSFWKATCVCVHALVYLFNKISKSCIRECKEYFKGLISVFYIHLTFYQIIFLIFQRSVLSDTMLLCILWSNWYTRKRWCFHSLIPLSRFLYCLASKRTEIYLSPHRNSGLKAVQKP